ncbi:MAG: 3-hydroxyacyl-CoA dehydrogenase NAD-binding domain-containing protein [Cyclobacteriaceae bacterium]|jgi:3-hydroxybutyryl-CoA dehydrogenase|nr:3-hydroxyacyl-CoA dehydrogenase NAD-binding domain-containing protein [Cyclobacteriaceae bacterium]
MDIQQLKRIGIIGAGTMGQGIAQVCAQAGYEVLLFDVKPELTAKAVKIIEKSLTQLVEKSKLRAEDLTSIMKRIHAVSELSAVQADLIIEAVVEKLSIKQTLFQELERINNPDCILATNTSSIPVTQIASVLKNPERFAGLHFFNPAPVMKLVEVISGISTSAATESTLIAFTDKLGKVPVAVKDSPGFIVNRVARHFYVEALKLAEENVADFKTIDALMRASGFRMGPFELMDLIGVDTNFSVTSSMYHAFHQEPRFRPSRLQQQKVDAGHLGRKSGKGFYDYK